MTNYSTQFSIMLPLPTGEDADQKVKDWYQDQFDDSADYDDEDYDENPYSGFNCSLDNRQLWIYEDEYGDVDNAANFIQKYLIDMDIDGGVGLTWANTCSCPRVNAFDGGAVVITKDKMIWQSSDGLFNEVSKSGIEILNF